jgi:hypothetical protein
LANSLFVTGAPAHVDLFCADFNYIRAWAREGQPMDIVRPVLRTPASAISQKCEITCWSFPDGFGVSLNLFGDFYSVDLTSSPTGALSRLREWADSDPDRRKRIWVIGNEFTPLDPAP